MQKLKVLFEQNAKWSQEISANDPEFFSRQAKHQSPDYLWIGCSDSRVPANQVVGLEPGELFEHRNVANLVIHTDLNCLSAIHYAVEALKVKHIIVCGHYGCGGVEAAFRGKELGLIENWLRHIQDVQLKYADRLDGLPDREAKRDRLCELNVIDQVVNVCRTTIVRDAWRRGQDLAVHGWIYGLTDGRLRDLEMCIGNMDEVETAAERAIVGTTKGLPMAAPSPPAADTASPA